VEVDVDDLRRRLIPTLYGADEEDAESPSEETPPQTQELSAEELEKMAARASDRGGRKAVNKLTEEAGFSSRQEMLDYIKAQREREDSEKSELEKAQTVAQSKLSEAQSLVESVQAERFDLAIERRVIRAGVADEKVERIVTLIKSEIGDTDPDAWNEDIEAALESVREDLPELFGKSSSATTGSGDGGVPTSPPPPPVDQVNKQVEELLSRGRVRLPG
jgi:hypothetical protein